MKTVIHLKTDQEVKQNAQTLAKELGITLSDVINVSLRNFIRTRELYISHNPRMTPELERLLDQVDLDLKFGKNISEKFDTAKSAVKHLDAL